jgi:branched-subunit amino acid ABC-type transport system permease component
MPDLTSYLTQFLNGLSYSMLLFLVAAGLSVIFGLMNVANLAHGTFYMIGGYIGYSVVNYTGNFWLSLIVAPIVVGVIGCGLELTTLRPLYKRGHLSQVLLTFGFVFIGLDLVKWIWGADIRSIDPPAILAWSTHIAGRAFPVYRLFLVGFGLLITLGLWLLLERSNAGAIVRSGVSDKEMAQGLGINVPAVFCVTFGLGVALAALSGVLAAPVLGLFPGIDFDILVVTLVVVVVGGMGSFRGCFWGSLLIGQLDTFGKVFFPRFSLFLIYLAMALILLIKPSGLFGVEER